MTDGGGPILFVKLGALGDIIQAMQAAAAVRRHHDRSRIVFLTTPPFAELGRLAPYFDEVWAEERPALFAVRQLLALRRRLRGGRFERVYDLQTSDRSSAYRHLFRPGRMPEWSGIARGASHPHRDPRRDEMHTLDRQADQLRAAGIVETPALPDVGWLAAAARVATPARRYALLVPGGSAHRLEKRWPAERFAAIAVRLVGAGVTPVIVGGEQERPLAALIREREAAAIDLTGQTGLADIAALGERALWAVGNDTGPLHVAVAAGAPAAALFSRASNPAFSAPRGKGGVTILQRPSLADLSDAEVWAARPPCVT